MFRNSNVLEITGGNGLEHIDHKVRSQIFSIDISLKSKQILIWAALILNMLTSRPTLKRMA
jgi:hypothetical protein